MLYYSTHCNNQSAPLLLLPLLLVHHYTSNPVLVGYALNILTSVDGLSPALVTTLPSFCIVCIPKY